MLLTVLIVILVILLKLIGSKLNPTLIKISEVEAKKHYTSIVNEVVCNYVNISNDTPDIFNTIVSTEGEIKSIDYNTNAVNKILNNITNTIQENLKLYDNSKKAIIAKVTLGSVLNNGLLSNIGPKIPIRIHYVNDINSSVKTKLTSYGINNVLIEISVVVDMTAQVYMPFFAQTIRLKSNIPIAAKVIQGNIPSYYGNSLLKDSAIYSLPID